MRWLNNPYPCSGCDRPLHEPTFVRVPDFCTDWIGTGRDVGIHLFEDVLDAGFDGDDCA